MATTAEGQLSVFEIATGLLRSSHALPREARHARLSLENGGRVLLGAFRGDFRVEALRWTVQDLQGKTLLEVPCPREAYGWDLHPSPDWKRVAQLPRSAQQSDPEPGGFRFAVCEAQATLFETDAEGLGASLAAWSPAGDRLAFLLGDGRLALWRQGRTQLDSLWLAWDQSPLAWLPGTEDRLLVREEEHLQVLDPSNGAVLADSGPIPTRPASHVNGFERLWATARGGSACATTWMGSRELTLVQLPPQP